MRGKKRSQKWAEVSKPDISGKVPEVAFKLAEKTRNNSSEYLTFQIVSYLPSFTKRYNYSAKLRIIL